MAWTPQNGPQLHAIDAAWMQELLFGGARGGGKSDYLLGDFAADVPVGETWRGILFRRTYPELEELIARSRMMYPTTFPGCEFKESSKTWHFPSGATLRMRYLEREADASRYQGHQYTWIGWDELTQWASDAAYKMLFACLRSGEGVKNKRVRASANPGGRGHLWVKDRFIDPAPGGYTPLDDGYGPRMFIPSRVQDNQVLLQNDPEYVRRLHMVGSAELVRAWLEGDWSIIEGAYFDCWNTERHVLRACKLPKHWTRFRSFDWGSAKPFSVGWWAVASEPFETPDGRLIPTGAMVRYREWYGKKEPNVGLKMTVEEVAEGIASRETEPVTYGIADPAIFAQDGGPSIAERMLLKGVVWRRGDNKRIPGWEQVRQRLIGEDDKPMMYVFNTCADFIRTFPALQHSETKPEDVDTDGEDHAGDEARYACMSRPWKAATPKPPEIARLPTFNELRDAAARKRMAEEY